MHGRQRRGEAERYKPSPATQVRMQWYRLHRRRRREEAGKQKPPPATQAQGSMVPVALAMTTAGGRQIKTSPRNMRTQTAGFNGTGCTGDGGGRPTDKKPPPQRKHRVRSNQSRDAPAPLCPAKGFTGGGSASPRYAVSFALARGNRRLPAHKRMHWRRLLPTNNTNFRVVGQRLDGTRRRSVGRVSNQTTLWCVLQWRRGHK